MSIDGISFSAEIRYHHSSQFVFYNILLFYSLIEVGFHCVFVFSAIVLFVSNFVLNIIQIGDVACWLFFCNVHGLYHLDYCVLVPIIPLL
jgi:hypothetical protein